MEGTSGNPQLWSWLSLPTPWGETRRGGSKSRTPAPTPAQPSGPLHPPPTSRGAGPEPLRMRRPSVPPPAPRPDFPRFTSLPLRRGCSFAATIGCRTSSSRPINATPSPPWTGDPGERRRPEEVSPVGAARTPGLAATSSRLPSAPGGLPHVGRGRGRGGLDAAVGATSPGLQPPGSPQAQPRSPNARGCGGPPGLGLRGRSGALQRGPAPSSAAPSPAAGRAGARGRGEPSGRCCRKYFLKDYVCMKNENEKKT
ncbi:uncharacterized protein LOC143271245 [Peromyscus maniculatus bairdii]|uniref:uncharacterized protein LOC143271245 n=1 Tax=Peromyscus maniculatus bairdii TaxID=230844 RepID=UPI003FD0F318